MKSILDEAWNYFDEIRTRMESSTKLVKKFIYFYSFINLQ